MARLLGLGAAAALIATLSGCTCGPNVTNPMLVRYSGPELENPMFIPPGQTEQGYKCVFDKIYDVVHQEFEICASNWHTGRIETLWKTSAGYFGLFRRKLFDHYENAEASFQSVRRRAEVEIAEADIGGYTVRIRVYKELEDLPQPTHGAAGIAVFRYDSPIQRQFEVITEAPRNRGWIPYGRDYSYEQVLLARIRGAL